jgi:hypothetical protein
LNKAVPLTRIVFAAGFGLAGLAAEFLPRPPQPTNPQAGNAIAAQTVPLAQANLGLGIYSQILAGNVPNFFRQFCRVNITNVAGGKINWATILVAPDYLAVGTNKDYLLTPLTPMTAQNLADPLDCTLPTPKMVSA